MFVDQDDVVSLRPTHHRVNFCFDCNAQPYIPDSTTYKPVWEKESVGKYPVKLQEFSGRRRESDFPDTWEVEQKAGLLLVFSRFC